MVEGLHTFPFILFHSWSKWCTILRHNVRSHGNNRNTWSYGQGWSSISAFSKTTSNFGFCLSLLHVSQTLRLANTCYMQVCLI